jgi:DNA-binding transcriptional regulator YbjK
VPPASTTYYFASRDELVAEAVRGLAEAQLAGARETVARVVPGPRPPEAVAGTLVAIVAGAAEGADRGRLLTAYERYVQAGRHPELRPVVRAWTAGLVELAGEVLRRAGHADDGDRAGLLVALIDGLLIALLVEDDVDAAAAATARVAAVLAVGGPQAGSTDTRGASPP